MGYVKDLWWADRRQPDGSTERVKTSRYGIGKRWASCWVDPDERSRSRSFANKTAAAKWWQKQEADMERGEYVDPKAGREKLEALAIRWLASISVDPTTKNRYETVWRLHVRPTFGQRAIKSIIRPSEIQEYLTALSERRGPSTVHAARHVLGSILELAVADGDLKRNPARHKLVSTGKAQESQIEVWSDETVWRIVDAHPPALRAIPLTLATVGMRESECYALCDDDIDFDRLVIRVRRQIKRLGRQQFVWGLPKNDKERTVPLPRSTAAALQAHMRDYPGGPVTLPWEKMDGEPRTYRLIFLQPATGHYLWHGLIFPVWRAALEAASLIGPKIKDPFGPGSGKRYVLDGNRKLGRHQLRHFYASTQLAAGTNIRELADYLGHADVGFTLRTYAHLLPDSFDRARQAIDDRFYRPRAVSNGTEAEHA